MSRAPFFALLLSALAGEAHAQSAPVVAILELRNKLPAGETVDTAFLSDVVRGQFLEFAPSAKIITRENILVLLQSQGKTLEDCEGECEVDTGRRLGADLVVSGEVLKFSDSYRITLRLHATREARLLSASIAAGQTLAALEAELPAALKKLTEPLGEGPAQRRVMGGSPWDQYGWQRFIELRGIGGVATSGETFLADASKNAAPLAGGGFRVGITPLSAPDRGRGATSWFGGRFALGLDVLHLDLHFGKELTQSRVAVSYTALRFAGALGLEWFLGSFDAAGEAWSGVGFGFDLSPFVEYGIASDPISSVVAGGGFELFLERSTKALSHAHKLGWKFFLGANGVSRGSGPSASGVSTLAAYGGLGLVY